jgi:hypothetical protein
LVAAAVTVGALSFGTAGIAAAAAPNPTTTVATTATPKASASTHPRLCAVTSHALAHLEKRRATIAAELPRLIAEAQKATKAGHTHRARRLDKKIARLQRISFQGRVDRASATIKAKCGV